MKRWRPARTVAVVLGGGCLLLALFTNWATREQVTTSRLSPDEMWRIWLVDISHGFVARNFSIRLERLATHEVVKLVRSSADEGRPAGTERFVWSKDGTSVLLVGRHFFVREDLMLAGGDQAYFLHDLKAGRSWINSEADTSFPPLTADLLAGVEFTEPVVLQPRTLVDPDSPANRE